MFPVCWLVPNGAEILLSECTASQDSAGRRDPIASGRSRVVTGDATTHAQSCKKCCHNHAKPHQDNHRVCPFPWHCFLDLTGIYECAVVTVNQLRDFRAVFVSQVIETF
jgi:hypothetical protein